MKNSKNKKTILLSMISFLIIILSLIIKSNITYGNEEDAYNFDDLKVGDYLPFGATVNVGKDYMTVGAYASNVVSFYYSSVNILYYESEDSYNQKNCDINNDKNYNNLLAQNNGILSNSCYDKVDIFNSSSVNNLSSYEKDFNLSKEYIGWLVLKIFANYIVLVPTTNYSKINVTPSIENSYTIDTTFIDTSDNQVDNQWYLVKNINNYDASDNNFWQKDNNVLHFLYKGTSQIGDTYTLTYTFEAMAGDILTFNARSWPGATFYLVSKFNKEDYDSYKITLNDKEINSVKSFELVEESLVELSQDVMGITGKQTDSLYETFNIKIEESGTQKLQFIYIVNGTTASNEKVTRTPSENTTIIDNDYPYNYGYVKGVTLLTPINEGAALDTSKVKNGDEVLYRSTSETTDYVLSERLTYENNDANSKIENPHTGYYVPFFGGLFLLTFIFLIFFRRINIILRI